MFDHDYRFDPTHGYDDDGLQAVMPPPVPDDFEAFWRAKFEAALSVEPNVERRPCNDFHSEHHRVEVVGFDAMGLAGEPSRRVHGWLVTPRDGEPVRGQVAGHGYGGRDAPDLACSEPPAARLFVCTRGFNLSAAPDLPVWAEHHVVHGLASRETYLHLGSVADHWAATACLEALYPELRGSIDYSGGSFGGGIGMLSCAWDDRIRRISVEVPSFGNHPLRLTLQCSGSGHHVNLYAQAHPDVIDVLQYFDAATAARFVKQPTLVCAARFDPAVPPPGQVCVYNALPGPMKKLMLIDGGHFEYPAVADDKRRYTDATSDWFAADPRVVSGQDA